MSQPHSEARDAAPSESMTQLLAAAGIVSTPEGRARARALLAKGREELPEKLAAVRTQLAAKQAEMFPSRRVAGE